MSGGFVRYPSGVLIGAVGKCVHVCHQLRPAIDGTSQPCVHLGIASALGQLKFGRLGDWAPTGKPLLGREVGVLGSRCIFQLGFTLLGLNQGHLLSSALALHIFGYCGLLALTAFTFSERMDAKEFGAAYWLLYQLG